VNPLCGTGEGITIIPKTDQVNIQKRGKKSHPVVMQDNFALDNNSDSSDVLEIRIVVMR